MSLEELGLSLSRACSLEGSAVNCVFSLCHGNIRMVTRDDSSRLEGPGGINLSIYLLIQFTQKLGSSGSHCIHALFEELVPR